MCFSMLDRNHERIAQMSMNISKAEYNRIWLLYTEQNTVMKFVEDVEDKGVTGVPVYGWKYVDALEQVQMASSIKFLKLDSCVEHGMNAENHVPDQYNNRPSEMKVFVDSVLYPDVDSLLSTVYGHLLKLEFRMRIKGP